MSPDSSSIRKPAFISGGTHSDERGVVSFVNDFQFREVKRFYSIEHPHIQTVRAWQGHQYEEKWFYAVEGSFQIAWVKIDNWEKPASQLKADHDILSSENCRILHIPGGFANGFRAIEPRSKLIVFSNFTLEESASDNYRFSKDLWFEWSQ